MVRCSFMWLLLAAAEPMGAPVPTYTPGKDIHPWHDRVGVWQLADVPAELCSGDPVPQQSCASRGLVVPADTAAITIAMGRGDVASVLAKDVPLRETDYEVTVQAPKGGRKLRYPVFVLRDPPAEIMFAGVCRAGIILLRLDEEGIESRPARVPENLRRPEKPLVVRERFHLYLLIGQSNMAGRGRVEPADLALDPRVLALDERDRWVVAVDPIHFDKPLAGVGLGTTFGKVVAARNPDAVIGLIPCAVGGTRVSQWQKDAPPVEPWGQLYENAVARARVALRDGVLKGVLWHQGEGDSSPGSISRYRARLTRLVEDLYADLGVSGVPFVAGKLGVWDPERHAQRQAFNANLEGLPGWLSPAAVVESEGLGHGGDSTHFSSKALRELGRRYAEAMLRLHGGGVAGP